MDTIAIISFLAQGQLQPVPGPTSDSFTVFSSLADKLTVISLLGLVAVAFLWEWILPGRTARAHAAQTEANADKRVEDARKDFERQLADKDQEMTRYREAVMNEITRTRAERDDEIKRLQSEIERLHDSENEWQRIALGALGVSERQGRVIERGIVQPLETSNRLLPRGRDKPDPP